MPPEFSDDQIFQIQSAVLQHCADQGDRFAVLDPPWSTAMGDETGLSRISAWRGRFESGYGALYFPWVQVYEPRETDTLRAIPPSGHVLGQIGHFDVAVGVHRAPANRKLAWMQDATVATSFGVEEVLNDLSINLIRNEGARGFRIMGARTLSSDPLERFVNVRRLVLAIKRGVNLLSQWVIFEPNNRTTRSKHAAVLSNFLAGLHARGAFSGVTPDQSFFVKCDEENNIEADRDAGRLIAEIGIAPAHPMEFLVMRVGRIGNALTVSETDATARAA